MLTGIWRPLSPPRGSATGTATSSGSAIVRCCYSSANARLPVILSIREAKRLPTVFPDAVCEMLATVGVPAANIAAERSRMREMTFGRTRNRSLLGTMNDFGFMAKFVDAKRTKPESPQELMRSLARTPILSLDGARPIDLTRAVHALMAPACTE